MPNQLHHGNVAWATLDVVNESATTAAIAKCFPSLILNRPQNRGDGQEFEDSEPASGIRGLFCGIIVEPPARDEKISTSARPKSCQLLAVIISQKSPGTSKYNQSERSIHDAAARSFFSRY
jgi:hypothetical protein